jgi:hypothetical protein
VRERFTIATPERPAQDSAAAKLERFRRHDAAGSLLSRSQTPSQESEMGFVKVRAKADRRTLVRPDRRARQRGGRRSGDVENEERAPADQKPAPDQRREPRKS